MVPLGFAPRGRTTSDGLSRIPDSLLCGVAHLPSPALTPVQAPTPTGPMVSGGVEPPSRRYKLRCLTTGDTASDGRASRGGCHLHASPRPTLPMQKPGMGFEPTSQDNHCGRTTQEEELPHLITSCPRHSPVASLQGPGHFYRLIWSVQPAGKSSIRQRGSLCQRNFQFSSKWQLSQT